VGGRQLFEIREHLGNILLSLISQRKSGESEYNLHMYASKRGSWLSVIL
jgi:hypothetical protein